MSTTSLIASEVMDRVSSIMNDTAQAVYTYVVQLPYLNMALDELQEEFELANVPVTNQASAIIQVPAGVVQIQPSVTPAVVGEVYYPVNLIEIQKIGERESNGSGPFSPIHPVDFLPMDSLSMQLIGVYTWQDQKIKFNATTGNREIKLDYIKDLFVQVTGASDLIGIINSQTYLSYKTGQFCSFFIGENKTRSEELKGMAAIALERSFGISSKGRQGTVTRRQPFRSRYRRT